ncbi:MAG: NUDIX hydrolase [Alphaproteobacteria bacterium]
MSGIEPRPVIGCAAVVWRGPEVLLIRRGRPPLKGQWSIPGGHQKWGETVRECALRELKEETGLDAEILGLIDVVDAIYRDDGKDYHFTFIDFAARMTGGEVKAGDDAGEARWHAGDSLDSLGIWSETLRVIRAARKFFLSP